MLEGRVAGPGLCHDGNLSRRSRDGDRSLGRGMAEVFGGSDRVGALIVLATAFALGGCGSFDFETASWFAKPLDVFGSRAGYTYANLGDVRHERPITANDLIDGNGACPRVAAAPPPPAPTDSGANAAAAPDMASLLGGGVAIGMSECDVVARLGQPSNVNLGRTRNGDRSAILTFASGPRPGVYRFAGGRLTEMDRVAEPPRAPEPAKKKKTAKRKPAQPEPPAKADQGS